MNLVLKTDFYRKNKVEYIVFYTQCKQIKNIK